MLHKGLIYSIYLAFLKPFNSTKEPVIQDFFINTTDKELGDYNMALVSPGVQVSVIDESFYTPAEPGTVPMIFVASAQDKINSSGTGTAQGTLAANAGKVFLMTSQRELAETFGDPVFKTDANNNPIHGVKQMNTDYKRHTHTQELPTEHSL